MTAYRLGRAAAFEALDQELEYSSLEDALEAYLENLGHTLDELGIRTEENEREALRGFEDFLVERGVSERPDGM